MKDYFKNLKDYEGSYIQVGACGNCPVFSRYYIMRADNLYIIIDTTGTLCSPQRIYYLLDNKRERAKRIKIYKNKNSANHFFRKTIKLIRL